MDELNKALGTDGSELKSLLKTTSKLVAGLNRQRDDIVTAIDGLNQLSERTVAQTDQIDRILGELPEAVQVLEDQRPQFVDLLTKLDRLGDVGTDIITKSREALITDLKALRPVLSELTKAAPDLITSLPLFPTIPFPDTMLRRFTVTRRTSSLRWICGSSIRSRHSAWDRERRSIPGQGESVPGQSGNPYINGNGPRSGWPTISLINPARVRSRSEHRPAAPGTRPRRSRPSRMPRSRRTPRSSRRPRLMTRRRRSTR